MVGLRILVAAALVTSLLAVAPRIAFARAAKAAFPKVVVDTAFETRGNSRDPSANATTFSQSFKIEPGLPSFELSGISVRASLSYLARLEGQDLPLAGGKAQSEYSFSAAGQDRFGRVQFGLGFSDRATIQPSSSLISPLRADTSSSQTYSMLFAPPIGPTVSASASRTFSSSLYGGKLASGSENTGGTVTMQYKIPNGTLRFTRTIGDSLTVPGGNTRSSESTQLSFDHALALPLGTLKTSYSYRQAGNDFLVVTGGMSETQEEYLKVGLQGSALASALDYSASNEQRRTMAPDGSLSEKQTQSFTAGVNLPLPGGGSGRAGTEISFNQATGPSQRMSTDSISYSIGLQPTEELNLSMSATNRETNDLLSKTRQNSYADLSGSLSFTPHQRFSLSANAGNSNGRDYTGRGSENNRSSYSLSARMSVRNNFNLNFNIGEGTSEDQSASLYGNSNTDSYYASASMNLRPSQQLFVNAAFRTDAYHRNPGNRDTGQSVNITVGYALSENVSWQFIYRGDDRWTRSMPWTRNFGDTIQTSFQFQF